MRSAKAVLHAKVFLEVHSVFLKHRRVSSCIVTALANVNSSFFARRQAGTGQPNTLALACTVDNLDMSSTPRVMPSSRAATAAQPKTEGFASKSPVIKVVTHGSVQASAPTQHLQEAFTRLPPCPSSQRLDETLTTIRKFLELRSKYMSATPAESSKAAADIEQLCCKRAAQRVANIQPRNTQLQQNMFKAD